MSRIEADYDAGVVTVTSGERLCVAKLLDLSVCGRPAAAAYRLGCAHEHVRDVPLCERCAERVERGLGDCRICLFEVDDRHPCRLMGRRLP